MNVLNNLLYRKFPGNKFKCVKVFHLNKGTSKLMLSLPIKYEAESVLIASINDYATSQILNSFPDCNVEEEQMYIVRHKAENIRMPLVTVVNSFCCIHNKEEVYEVHYYSPPRMPLAKYLNILEEQESESF